MNGIAKGNQKTARVKGEKGRGSEPKKAHCLTGAANLYGRWKAYAVSSKFKEGRLVGKGGSGLVGVRHSTAGDGSVRAT